MGIENGKTQGRRMVHMEVMRIIAVYFVIFNHTTDNGFTLFYNRPWGGYAILGVSFYFCILQVCGTFVSGNIRCIDVKQG